MTNRLSEGLVIVQQKQSGALWILAAVIMLLMIIPLLIYGLFLSSKNTIVWVMGRSERKLKRMQRKQSKLQTKKDIKDIKEQLTEAKEV